MLAQGGIQLSEMAVPTQVNFGVGAPADANAAAAGGEAIGAGACVRWGYSVDMSVDTLNAKYPSHAAYVAKVKAQADALVASTPVSLTSGTSTTPHPRMPLLTRVAP